MEAIIAIILAHSTTLQWLACVHVPDSNSSTGLNLAKMSVHGYIHLKTQGMEEMGIIHE